MYNAGSFFRTLCTALDIKLRLGESCGLIDDIDDDDVSSFPGDVLSRLHIIEPRPHVNKEGYSSSSSRFSAVSTRRRRSSANQRSV
jgi:hypothetical protein